MSKRTIEKNKLLLIDGTAQIFRAFYGIRPLADPEGRQVNAVYGVASMLLGLKERVAPTHMAVVFDLPEPTHRHKMYPEYKANREKAPEDLCSQIPLVKELVQSFGIAICEKSGIEADDVLSVLAEKAGSDSCDVLIVTNDKDLFQVVNKHVHIYRPLRGGKGEYEDLDEQGVLKTFGVLPHQVPDVLALMGDSSDNIPGVPGVGSKTAVDLITTHGSLANLYNELDKIKRQKLKEKLENHRDDAMRSFELVQVLKHTDLPVEWETCKSQEGLPDTAFDSMKKFGFKRMLAMYQTKDTKNSQIATSSEKENSSWFTGVQLENDLDVVLNEAQKRGVLVCECLSDGLALAASVKKAIWLSCDGEHLSEELKKYNRLTELLTDKKIKKISYNLKPFEVALYKQEKELIGEKADLHLVAHLLDLPANSIHRFVERLLGTVPGETEAQQAFLACAILQLTPSLFKQLKQEKGDTVYQDIELPLLSVLASMEGKGVAIDRDALHRMGKQFGKTMAGLEKKIHDEAGMEFNIRSPQQLAEVLFDHLQLTPGKKTKTGRSTSVDVLENLAPLHTVPANVLEYRKYQKIKSTYLDVLPTLLDNTDQRIHTTFHQVGAATGRLSSSDPNLQNIPIRTEIGQKLREMFVPEQSDWCLLSADYSQIELRLLAHLSEDEQMCRDFKEGLDIHAAMAAEIFNVPLEEVTSDMRRQAKTCNFGIAYGVSPFGLARQIGVSHYQAKEFIDGFYKRYPGVQDFIDQLLIDARANGYVSTLFGRRRPIGDVLSANRNIREAGERMAINTPIQGSAADLIKMAMIVVSGELKKKKWQSKMILQVHDELLFEGPKHEMDELKVTVVKIMANVHPLNVDLVVDAAWGDNWKQAHS